MAKIDLILELITSDAQKSLNDFKVKVRSIGDEKIKLNTGADALAEAKKLSSAFDLAKKNAGDVVNVSRNVVASLALAGKSGTKEFTEAKKQLSLAKKEANEFEKALKKADPTGFGDKFKSVTKNIGALGLATAAGFGINELVGSFTALDTATQKIKTLGGEATNLAPQFKAIALEMSKSFPIAAGEIQDSIYEALSAGVEASESSIKAFSDSAAKLSVGGGETMKNSVNILSSVLNSYGASAQEAAHYSDILFNTVNIGKTTIPELNHSLSQVVPTAASVGVSLENVGASLAVLTANGMPTARATTTLNQLLVEMIKPGNDFAAVMQKAGVSLETLKTEGLPTTVEKLKSAMAEMGKTSGAVFGSTDAAAAFAVLAKDVDGFKEAMDGVTNVTGSTEKAFGFMQESVTVKLEQLKVKLESTFLSVADKLLPAITDGLDVFAGAIDSVSFLLKDYGGLILGITAAVVAYNVAMKAKDGVNSFISGINDSILAAKKKIIALKETALENATLQATQKATAAGMAATTVAVKGTSVAFQGLKAAFMSNPFGIILAGVTALIPAISWLSDVMTESTEEKLENAKAAEELTKKQIDETKATLTATEQKKELVDEYIKLAENSKRTAEEQSKFEALQKQITEKYPDLISKTGEFRDSLGYLKEESQKTASEINNLNSSLTKYNQQYIAQQVRNLRLTIDVTKNELLETITDTYTGDAEKIMVRIVEKYTEAIKNAKTKEESQKLSNELTAIVSGDAKILLQALKNNKQFLWQQGIDIDKVYRSIFDTFDSRQSDLLKAANNSAKIAEYSLNEFEIKAQKELQIRIEALKQAGAEENAYDRIIKSIDDLSKKYKSLSETRRTEIERNIKADIAGAMQTKKINESQQNALELQLQKIKENTKENTKINTSKKNEILENIKLEESALLKELERTKKIADNQRIAEGRAKTLKEEKQDLLSEVGIYEHIREKLLSLETKFKTAEAKKEFKEYLEEIEESVTDINLEVGTVDAKITVDDREAQKKLTELSKEELEWKLEVATNTNDIQSVIALKEALLELRNADLYNLSLQLQIAGDDVTRKELELKIQKLQQEINAKQLEIGIDYQKLDLEGITDVYEYQFKAGLLEAKLAYEQDLLLAQGNVAKKTEAERKFQDERNRLQNEYLEKSLKFSDTLTLASRKFGTTLLDNFTKNMNPVQDAIAKLQEQLQNLGKTETDYSSQEKALNESLKNREISVKEYYAKLRELDQKRLEETEGMSKTELRIRSGVSSALLEISKVFDSKIQKLLQENSIKAQDNLKKMIDSGKKGTELLTSIYEANQEDFGKLAENVAGVAAASFGAMLAAGVEFGEAFRKSVLGTLLQTAQQAILANIPWIYTTFAAMMGPFGYAAATAAIAIAWGYLEAAKSAINLKAGLVDIQGPGTETSDSIPVNLSRGESAINARGTRSNKELLRWINKTGRPAYEYYQNMKQNNTTIQGGVSSQDFATLSNEVKAMREQIEILNRRKSTLNAVDVKINVDDKELIKRIEHDKLAALRRM